MADLQGVRESMDYFKHLEMETKELGIDVSLAA